MRYFKHRQFLYEATELTDKHIVSTFICLIIVIQAMPNVPEEMQPEGNFTDLCYTKYKLD